MNTLRRLVSASTIGIGLAFGGVAAAQTYVPGDPLPPPCCVPTLAKLGEIVQADEHRRDQLTTLNDILQEFNRLPQKKEVTLVCPYLSANGLAVAIRTNDRPVEFVPTMGGPLRRDELDAVIKQTRSLRFEANRERLKSQLGLESYPELFEHSATPIVVDVNQLGILPGTLSLSTRAVTLASNTLAAGLNNLGIINSRKLDMDGSVVVCAYPVDSALHDQVFPSERDRSATWRDAQERLRTQVLSRGGRLIDAEQATPMGKTALLETLAGASNIAVLSAHANERGELVFPQTGKTEPLIVRPSDIRGLHLKNRPLVVIRICNGQGKGWAEAFLAADACAVWLNYGEVAPDDAVDDVGRLFDPNAPTESIYKALIRARQKQLPPADSPPPAGPRGDPKPSIDPITGVHVHRDLKECDRDTNIG